MIPNHIKKIKSFLAMEILEALQKKQATGESVISFSLGEPDQPPPPEVEKACQEALKDQFTKYTNSQGLLELREEIAAFYKSRYRVDVDPDQIIVTGGSSPAFLLTFSVLLGMKDELILSNPHYPCYPAFVEYLRGKSVFVKLREEDGFQYRPEMIQRKITSKTRALLINSPANPTGTVLSKENLQEIAEMTGRKRWIVADEIYHGLAYKGEEHSILEFTKKAFVISGFSKAFAMTGYRLGYVIAPKPFVRTLQIINQNFFISANSFVQKAGIAALKAAPDYLPKIQSIYNERRLAMLEGVRRIGFGVPVEPTGAFYILANAKKFGKKSHRLALDILEKTGVGVTPGIDFGSGAEGYIRFSYATSLENIKEGLRRIEIYVSK